MTLKQMIELVIPIDPVGKARPRVTRSGHAYTPAGTVAAENAIRFFAKKHLSGRTGFPMTGPVGVSIDFCFIKPASVKRIYHTTRPDCDNLTKLVCDALNGILWDDDSIIQYINCQKLYETDGKIRINAWEICSRYENEKPGKKEQA